MFLTDLLALIIIYRQLKSVILLLCDYTADIRFFKFLLFVP